MSTNAHALLLRQFLANTCKRLDLISALEGAAAGCLAATVLAIVAFGAGWTGIAMAAAGATAILAIAVARLALARRSRPSLSHVANMVERRAGGCRNVVVTASELAERDPEKIAPRVAARVYADAAALVGGMKLERLFPARRAAYALAAGSSLWIAMLVLATRGNSPLSLAANSARVAAISDVTVVVVPPAYSGLDTVALRNPERVQALVGSILRLNVAGAADSMQLEMLAGTRNLPRVPKGGFGGEVLADADGFIGVRALAVANGGQPATEARRLIGLSVTPDRAPRARVTLPGRDLFVPDGRRTIALAVEADDDIALASLNLRYTRVSGSGEQFAFTDGEVPLVITRSTTKAWQASGSWDISRLSLVPGDMVIYRAVAADTRPNAPAADSDTYILEIAGPGALLAGGFSIDDEFDRYAVSQQMVILKSERLLARKPTTATQAFALEAMDLAAEQRKVRAEFIFMMGGELADEVEAELAGLGDLDEHAHVALDDEAISGRLAHEGRLDLIRAIRSMSHASASLTGAQLDSALTHERLALTYLQRAFARTRYILRTLTERERLDPARRLTGVLATAARDVAPAKRAEADANAAALRAILSDLATLAATAAGDAEAASVGASSLALRVLRIDPSASALQGVSTSLNEAAAALRQSRASEGRTLLQNAARSLATALRAKLSDTPASDGSAERRRLEGALADALRKVRDR